MADCAMEALKSELAELRTEFRQLREDVDKLKTNNSVDEGATPSQSKPLNIKLAAPSNFGSKFHQWNSKTLDKVPAKIPRPYGVAMDGKVYFNAGFTTRGGQYQSFVHRFDTETEKWTTLPKSTQYYSSMAIIQDMVTLIGGKIEGNGRITGNLVSFQESGKSGEWQECLPPLPTPRFFSGAATYENILVVVGGEDGKKQVANVEILDMDSMQWTEVSPLPGPTSNATVTIIGDSVFLLAGTKGKGNSNEAYCCSLTSLVTSSPADEEIWEVLPPVPQDSATATVMSNTLVGVGGWEKGRSQPVKTMVAYSTDNKKWNVIGYLPKAVAQPGVIPLDAISKSLIVGGLTTSNTYSDDAIIVEAKN